MKKAMLLMAILATSFLYAQNNFPTNGQVTIGTATASAGTALDVNGRVVIDSSLTVKDSLVVEQRIRAKDKLIVDGKAVFKDDAVVRLNLKVDGNARVQSNLRVDGVARLNGNVRMLNIGNINSLNNVPFDFLVRKDNGQVKKASPINVAQYLGAIGNIFGCAGDGNGNILSPMWQSAINTLFVDCPQVNVGIGTNNPQHKLTVAGTSYALTFLAGATNSPQNALYNGYESSNLKDLMHLGKEINGGAGNQTYEERFTVANSGAVVITNAGNDASLTINTSTASGVEIMNQGSNSSLVINNGTGSAVRILANNGTQIIDISDDGTINYRMNGGAGMIFKNTGNHEIVRISNNGVLYAKEIVVKALPFPDYVFEKDYNLMPLKEVKEFVNAKKHLPGIPPAKEVKNNGMSVGEMQVLEMEKIENIYLYLFELEERISSLEKENKELKAQSK